ncbi:hypothetical protein BJ508DRAFT_313948 [Ascobolus immersus RN42]|uniref:Uncharacterized protein n=1 Tax=Ascobolus immersus RN42 TaxID=1160509 RepID=A0A3N4HUA8_ASCIM|nr:hypothetical protein BJ508DRAFT_313948 [Ascobolus immersus RN42]
MTEKMSGPYYTPSYYSAERPSTFLTLPLRKVTTSKDPRSKHPTTSPPIVSTIKTPHFSSMSPPIFHSKQAETTTSTIVVTETASFIASSPICTDNTFIPPHAHPKTEPLPINSNGSKHEARFSTPQIAGITTSAIAILIFVTIAWLLFQRRKIWHQMRETEEVFEKDGDMLGMSGEALGIMIEEMPTDREVVEICGLDFAYEMPATPVLDLNRKNRYELEDSGKDQPFRI